MDWSVAGPARNVPARLARTRYLKVYSPAGSSSKKKFVALSRISSYQPMPRFLLKLETASYEGSTMQDDHPIAWCHELEGGRAFYTGLGHTRESYDEPLFLRHLLKGILWAGRRHHETE